MPEIVGWCNFSTTMQRSHLLVRSPALDWGLRVRPIIVVDCSRGAPYSSQFVLSTVSHRAVRLMRFYQLS